jgi:type IV pilus assembly protein PilA
MRIVLGEKMTCRLKGFSLIELLVVVAIILIIAAILIPNVLRSRMAANEASAVGSIRAINVAAVGYNITYGNGFPPSLAAVGTTTGAVGCTNAELIDSALTTGTKGGYTFFLQHGLTQLTSADSSCFGAYGYADGYAIEAMPVIVGTTGQRAFCLDATGVIRFNATGAVSPFGGLCLTTDNPLQEGAGTLPGGASRN